MVFLITLKIVIYRYKLYTIFINIVPVICIAEISYKLLEIERLYNMHA